MMNSRRRYTGHRPGFTLVEIMMVIVIIGLLVTMSIPTIKVINKASKKTRLINDFRQIRGAFEVYSLDEGGWPADVGPGVFPDEMEGYLARSLFENKSAFGGNWDWEGIDTGVAGITLRNSIIDDELMVEVDEEIDDGSLDTGHFRKGVVSGSGYTYVLEE